MAKYNINEKDKAWIEEAYLKGFTSLQMIKKLKELLKNKGRSSITESEIKEIINKYGDEDENTKTRN